MKQVLNFLFFPLYGILRPFNLFFEKCYWVKHKWDKYETEKNIDLKMVSYNYRHAKPIKGKLQYRICTVCGKQEKRVTFLGTNTSWSHVNEKPKEIKTYMSKINLDNKDKKILEEYISNLNG